MKPILLCLHGWGGSSESFTELRAGLEGKEIEILTPDLPGFGDEPEPTKPWSNDDYADWVEHYVRKHIKGHFLLLGHSHGGRIAIKLAARKSLPINHLFLCAAAGVRRGQPLKRAVGLLLAKTGKLLLSFPLLVNRFQPLAKKILYRLMRTHDYETASPLMRQTMIRVTTENISPLLSRIHIPTDIFWGEDDRVTPLADGLLMHRLIRGSALHIYENTRHAVHRDRAREIAKTILTQWNAHDVGKRVQGG